MSKEHIRKHRNPVAELDMLKAAHDKAAAAVSQTAGRIPNFKPHAVFIPELNRHVIPDPDTGKMIVGRPWGTELITGDNIATQQEIHDFYKRQ